MEALEGQVRMKTCGEGCASVLYLQTFQLLTRQEGCNEWVPITANYIFNNNTIHEASMRRICILYIFIYYFHFQHFKNLSQYISISISITFCSLSTNHYYQLLTREEA